MRTNNHTPQPRDWRRKAYQAWIIVSLIILPLAVVETGSMVCDLICSIGVIANMAVCVAVTRKIVD